MAAKNILQVAERVENALAEAQDLQKVVDDGVLTTNQDIVDATNSITKVSTLIIRDGLRPLLGWLIIFGFLLITFRRKKNHL